MSTILKDGLLAQQLAGEPGSPKHVPRMVGDDCNVALALCVWWFFACLSNPTPVIANSVPTNRRFRATTSVGVSEVQQAVEAYLHSLQQSSRSPVRFCLRDGSATRHITKLRRHGVNNLNFFGFLGKAKKRAAFTKINLQYYDSKRPAYFKLHCKRS